MLDLRLWFVTEWEGKRIYPSLAVGSSAAGRLLTLASMAASQRGVLDTVVHLVSREMAHAPPDAATQAAELFLGQHAFPLSLREVLAAASDPGGGHAGRDSAALPAYLTGLHITPDVTRDTSKSLRTISVTPGTSWLDVEWAFLHTAQEDLSNPAERSHTLSFSVPPGVYSPEGLASAVQKAMARSPVSPITGLPIGAKLSASFTAAEGGTLILSPDPPSFPARASTTSHSRRRAPPLVTLQIRLLFESGPNADRTLGRTWCTPGQELVDSGWAASHKIRLLPPLSRLSSRLRQEQWIGGGGQLLKLYKLRDEAPDSDSP